MQTQLPGIRRQARRWPPGSILLTGFILLTGIAAPAGDSPAADHNQVYVIPFSHLDLMWAGTREECLSRGNRIIDKAVQIVRGHPEFRFLLEDDVFVANYVETHRGSAELEELKRLVKNGSIEIAPKWAGIYQNLPRGEALVRNVLYGKAFAREVFQVDPQVAHLCDIPGFTTQLPQVYARSEVPFMVMTRMGPPDCSLFRYQSPDGSSVLVWNTIKGYGWGVGLGLHRPSLAESNFTNIARSIGQVQATTRGPISLGWGTDLFAPSDNLVTNLARLNERLAPLRFQFATPVQYFKAAAQVPELPQFSGEIPSSWANLLTSLSQLWPPTVHATDTLLSAEKFAALNYALGYADYPQAEFESLWKGVLETLDHNNFGQGGDLGDERKLEYAATATMRGGEILRQMLRNLAERVQSPFPRSTPVVVFNPLNWRRDDLVRAHVSVYGDVAPGDIADYRKASRLVDETGTAIPFHVEQSYGTVSRASEISFIAREVPALGYKTYFLVPADRAETFPDTCISRPDETDNRRVLGSQQFENESYRITIDQATGRITLLDKELNRPVVKDMELTAAEARGGNSISLEPLTGRTFVNRVRRVALEENNPVRTVVRLEEDLAGVPITQRISLYRSLKRVDLETTVDWLAGRLMKLEQLFPCEATEAQIRYGIPFGSAAAADLFPNSGPHAGDEIPREEWKKLRQFQDWIFVGTSDSGLTIAADRQLFVLDGGVVRVGLMRGTWSTTGFNREGKPALIPVPPEGKYVFRYSLTSGKSVWPQAKPYRAGSDFSHPLIPVTAVDELSAKSLPPSRSFCPVTADTVLVTALKKAERSDDLVLRLVEMEGADAGLSLQFPARQARFKPVNLLEEAAKGAPEAADSSLRPFSISTFDLSWP